MPNEYPAWKKIVNFNEVSLMAKQQIRNTGSKLWGEAELKDGLICFVLLILLGWETLELDSLGKENSDRSWSEWRRCGSILGASKTVTEVGRAWGRPSPDQQYKLFRAKMARSRSFTILARRRAKAGRSPT